MSKQKVWVLQVGHEYGINVSVHRSAKGANKALRQYVRAWWAHEVDDTPCPRRLTSADTERYFDAAGESYKISEQQVLQ